MNKPQSAQEAARDFNQAGRDLVVVIWETVKSPRGFRAVTVFYGSVLVLTITVDGFIQGWSAPHFLVIAFGSAVACFSPWFVRTVGPTVQRWMFLE